MLLLQIMVFYEFSGKPVMRKNGAAAQPRSVELPILLCVNLVADPGKLFADADPKACGSGARRQLGSARLRS